MKTKIIGLTGILFALMQLLSCNDSLDQIGMGSQPGRDKLQIFGDSLSITGTTVKDSVLYAKTINGLLGRFYDPQYGELEAGYMCQFYPQQGFNMDSVIGVDSIKLNILYTTYVGDSLAPMEVTVYPVIKPLTADYYTNVNFDEYYDRNAILGKKVYTARDMNISDSLNLANIQVQNYKIVSVSLPTELGNLFYTKYKEHNYDNDPAAVAQFFPGVYLETSLGSGCLLNVEKTDIYIYYSRETAKPDSVATWVSVLEVTKEIIQLNKYKSRNDEKLTDPANTTHMYLKTPAGIFAQVSIPISLMKDKVRNQKFSNVRLSIQAEPESEWEHAWKFPGTGIVNTLSKSYSRLMLIEPDSINSFFEKRQLADNKIAYLTALDSKTKTYTFDNIANIIQNAMDKNIDPLVLRLVPVWVPYYEYSNGYSTSIMESAPVPYLSPSAVTLKKGDLKLYTMSSDVSY